MIKGIMSVAAESWGFEEFGHAELGDERRTKRVVAIASAALDVPDGLVTSVFRTSAAREGAFRFLENDAVPVEALADAQSVASAKRAAGLPFVYMPIDGTSLNLTDDQRRKGFGVVGARFVGAQGLQVMTAMAVAPSGAPLGIGSQEFWARRQAVRRGGRLGGRKDRRPVDQKETRHWLGALTRVTQSFGEHAPGTRPWFQLDRGGDCWNVLKVAHDEGLLLTVRASKNRRLWTDKGHRYLWPSVAKTPIRDRVKFPVTAGPARAARHAALTIRFAPVVLDLHDNKGKNRSPAEFFAVLVRETGTCPHGEKPIEWFLLTTKAVTNVEQAREVIHGYSRRWLIEEFHRTWKSGTCNVERTQLRSCHNVIRWATILSSVAARILRITKLARSEPDAPATQELTQGEIDAVILTKKTTRYRPGDVPTLKEVVTWIAEIGGYTGKSSGGPPGAKVITRGLARIEVFARYLDDSGASRKSDQC